MLKKLKLWLIAAVVTTGLSALVYIAVQQDLRQAANDPQIQMAEDIAAELSSGQQPETVVPTTKVDIAKSLAPFIIIYDNSGKPLTSSATLDSETPDLPQGVLDYAKQNGENRLTWQPKVGVRTAVVVTSYTGTKSGYVLVGRSLREVEKREDLLTMQVSSAWVVTLLVLGGVVILYPVGKNKESK